MNSDAQMVEVRPYAFRGLIGWGTFLPDENEAEYFLLEHVLRPPVEGRFEEVRTWARRDGRWLEASYNMTFLSYWKHILLQTVWPPENLLDAWIENDWLWLRFYDEDAPFDPPIPPESTWLAGYDGERDTWLLKWEGFYDRRAGPCQRSRILRTESLVERGIRDRFDALVATGANFDSHPVELVAVVGTEGV